MCGPRQLFFQCGPETSKGWTSWKGPCCGGSRDAWRTQAEAPTVSGESPDLPCEKESVEKELELLTLSSLDKGTRIKMIIQNDFGIIYGQSGFW